MLWNCEGATADEDKGDSVYLYRSFRKAPNVEFVALLLLFLITCCLKYEIGFDMTKWIAQAACNEIQILSS